MGSSALQSLGGSQAELGAAETGGKGARGAPGVGHRPGCACQLFRPTSALRLLTLGEEPAATHAEGASSQDFTEHRTTAI